MAQPSSWLFSDVIIPPSQACSPDIADDSSTTTMISIGAAVAATGNANPIAHVATARTRVSRFISLACSRTV